MSAFKLNTGDSEFKDRHKKVFDQLLVLEKNRRGTSNEHDSSEPRVNRRAQRHETRHFRGKESIFKKPQNPAPKNYMNKIPDFKKNPHKWTKYSLEDVQDVTEESNTKSAMDFLRELADRRKLEQGIVEEKMDELPSKVIFNRHVRTTTCVRVSEITGPTNEDITSITQSVEAEEKPTFSSSKLVMPEYVIGQKIEKRTRKIKKTKPEKGKELKLDHLAFEDE